MKLKYTIVFVADMAAAVRFHRDTLGLTLRFESPHWTEFDTGSVTLALHPATADNAPGTFQLGLEAGDVDAFIGQVRANGLRITREPADEHGVRLARFEGADGLHYAVSSPRR
jgi:lactoylglutathione lyase